MDALTFLAVLCCLGVVLFWHIRNESIRSSGEKGDLATRPNKRIGVPRSYSVKRRRNPRRHAQ